LYLKESYNIQTFFIPPSFPAGLYEQLRTIIHVQFDDNYFQTQRQIKTIEEIDLIRRACRLTSAALLHARKILQDCSVDDNQRLCHRGKILTSEILRKKIEYFCLQRGGICQDTIVSCSQQSAHPHHPGAGALSANNFIVIDLFPHLKTTPYYGDMTRTFLKGTASYGQKQMMSCVRDCQAQVIRQIKPGVNTHDLMTFAENYFEQCGFGLKKSKKGFEGFIHSLGHGIGLSLHEPPSIGHNSTVLEPNMVFTVEPGLYFRTIGGVRIEDVVQVTPDGCRLLSHCPYQWQL
jgi:Xaa-Pro aminopeptidase